MSVDTACYIKAGNQKAIKKVYRVISTKGKICLANLNSKSTLVRSLDGTRPYVKGNKKDY